MRLQIDSQHWACDWYANFQRYVPWTDLCSCRFSSHLQLPASRWREYPCRYKIPSNTIKRLIRIKIVYWQYSIVRYTVFPALLSHGFHHCPASLNDYYGGWTEFWYHFTDRIRAWNLQPWLLIHKTHQLQLKCYCLESFVCLSNTFPQDSRFLLNGKHIEPADNISLSLKNYKKLHYFDGFVMVTNIYALCTNRMCGD